MKAMKSLVVAALAATGVAIGADAQAATHASGGARFATGHWSGGHWAGWRGHWYGPRVGFYIGAPILWSAWYWGYPYYYPYYYDYYYPRAVYGPGPYAYPEADPGPTTEAMPGPGAPTQGPLYMNYCDSAKAYYPKVTSCPEGWKFLPAR